MDITVSKRATAAIREREEARAIQTRLESENKTMRRDLEDFSQLTKGLQHLPNEVLELQEKNGAMLRELEDAQS
jgi:hypothetical protein